MSAGHEEHEVFSGPWWRFPPMRAALAAGSVALATWLLGHPGGLTQVEPLGYALAALIGGRHFFREALAELWHERAVGIDLLMSAAALGAALLGLWDEAAVLVFLYASAEALEEYAYARTRSAIGALLDLAPKEARVLREGREETVKAVDLRRGDVIVVRPGEGVPTDGVIREGTTAVDESPVTGESIPVDKGPGAAVFAGTLNRHGAFVMEAMATFEDNTLARIVHLVEEAQEQKGRIQDFIERFGRRYSPTVLAAALALLTVPPLFGQPFIPWALRAIVLLVAAAPCALVMSTPVAAAAGIGTAGRHGVLIKGGIHLENLGRVSVVAFDKTGTLTEGMPEVTNIISLTGGDAGEILRLAAGVERLSEHPVAGAVVRKAQERSEPLPTVAYFEALPGLGATGVIDQRRIRVGSLSLVSGAGIAVPPDAREQTLRLQEEGNTVIAVAADQTLIGLVAVRDKIRPHASAALRALRQIGIRTVMLTGDNAQTAKAIGREVGVDEIHAELRPDEKVEQIRRLEHERGLVAMIGDGINDAPALASATVGIAMGVAGTDAAIEAADVALMGDDLSKVAYALRLGRAARAISVQNILFSLLILGVLIPGAVLGALSVVAAVFAHEISELLAVANGLRVARQT